MGWGGEGDFQLAVPGATVGRGRAADTVRQGQRVAVTDELNTIFARGFQAGFPRQGWGSHGVTLQANQRSVRSRGLRQAHAASEATALLGTAPRSQVPLTKTPP